MILAQHSRRPLASFLGLALFPIPNPPFFSPLITIHYSSKPLHFNLFADPHPLTPVASIFYKNRRGGGALVPPGHTSILVHCPDLSPLFATLTKTPGVWAYSSH